jgi:hypothetical protein
MGKLSTNQLWAAQFVLIAESLIDWRRLVRRGTIFYNQLQTDNRLHPEPHPQGSCRWGRAMIYPRVTAATS